MESLDQLKAAGVFCDLFFTLGIPFEKKEDVQQTIRLQKMIRYRYPNVRGIRTFTVEMEPGSPWHLEPEEYGVRSSLNNFMDFYHYHSGDKNAFSSLGYWIPDYFDEEKDEKGFEEALQKIKCRHFCFIHPEAKKSSTPFWGRRLCDLSSLCWKVKGFVSNRKPTS